MANSLDASPGTQQNLVALIAFAQAEGWTVSQTQGGQLIFTKPGRPAICTRFTASAYRVYRNASSHLRRVDLRTTPRGLSALTQQSGS